MRHIAIAQTFFPLKAQPATAASLLDLIDLQWPEVFAQYCVGDRVPGGRCPEPPNSLQWGAVPWTIRGLEWLQK